MMSLKDKQIFADILKSRRDLMDRLLRKIRIIAHAVFEVHVVADVFFFPGHGQERRCGKCDCPLFLVSVHLRPSIEDSASATGDGWHTEGRCSGLELPVICLDCAVRQRPPLSGFNLTLPSWLVLSIERETQFNTVITRISHGRSSALPKPHLLRTEGSVDLRYRCEHRLASVSTSVNQKEERHSIVIDSISDPGSSRISTIDSDGDEVGWSVVDEEVLRRVSLAKRLMDMPIPTLSHSEVALQLRLEQRQLKRALRDVLLPPHCTKIHCPDFATLEGRMDTVRQEIEVATPDDACKDSRQNKRKDRPVCPGFSREFMHFDGKSCLQLLHEMESERGSGPVRYISVPSPRMNIESDTVIPIVVAPQYPATPLGHQPRPALPHMPPRRLSSLPFLLECMPSLCRAAAVRVCLESASDSEREARDGGCGPSDSYELQKTHCAGS